MYIVHALTRTTPAIQFSVFKWKLANSTMTSNSLLILMLSSYTPYLSVNVAACVQFIQTWCSHRYLQLLSLSSLSFSLCVYTTKTYKGFVWTLIFQNGNGNDSFRLLYFCWRNSRIRNEIKFVKTWQCRSHFSYSCARTHTHTAAARHSTLVRLIFWIKSKSDEQIVVQMCDRRNKIGMKRRTHTTHRTVLRRSSARHNTKHIRSVVMLRSIAKKLKLRVLFPLCFGYGPIFIVVDWRNAQ